MLLPMSPFDFLSAYTSDRSGGSLAPNNTSSNPVIHGSLTRTRSNRNLSRQGGSRVRSSLSRQGSLSMSAQERAAQSARKARIKSATQSKLSTFSNPVVRGFKRLVNVVVPKIRIFGTPTEESQPTCTVAPALPDPSLYTESHLAAISDENLDMDVSTSSSIPEVAMSTGLMDYEQYIDVDDHTYSGTALHSFGWYADPFYGLDPRHDSFPYIDASKIADSIGGRGDDSAEEFVAESSPSPEPMLLEGRNELLKQYREQVARGMEWAKEKEQEILVRKKMFDMEKAIVGEEWATRLQHRRDLDQKLNSFEDQRERALCLDEGFDEMLRIQECREVASLPSDEMDILCRHERDEVSQNRTLQAQDHSYFTSIRSASLTWDDCHFNTCGSPFLSEHVMRVEYRRYKEMWMKLAEAQTEITLTFSTVPWPLPYTPRTPEDITSYRIWEFLLNGITDERSRGSLSRKKRREIARSELYRWYPDNVTNWIMARVVDPVEREAIRLGVRRVTDALVLLMPEAD